MLVDRSTMSCRKIHWGVERDRKDDHSDYIQKAYNHISLCRTFIAYLIYPIPACLNPTLTTPKIRSSSHVHTR